MVRKIRKPPAKSKPTKARKQTATSKKATAVKRKTATAKSTKARKQTIAQSHGRVGANFRARVYEVVRQCPRGQAISYGGVAALLGQPRAARAVGHALSLLEAGSDVPWWRVVNRNGEISIKSADHAPIVQRKLLEDEGVRFRRDRIDWEQFGWSGESVVVPSLEVGANFDDGSQVSRKRRKRT